MNAWSAEEFLLNRLPSPQYLYNLNGSLKKDSYSILIYVLEFKSNDTDDIQERRSFYAKLHIIMQKKNVSAVRKFYK